MKLLFIIFKFMCNPISMVFSYFLRVSRFSRVNEDMNRHDMVCLLYLGVM